MQTTFQIRKRKTRFLLCKIFEHQIILAQKEGTNYDDITKHVETHVIVKSDKESTKTTLKWVHIAISNAKRTLLGVYHKIHRKYLQSYLDEFCYKLNRHYFGDKLFDRLVISLTTTKG